MSYGKYGLSQSDASSADHDKGIVAGPDGKYYSIDGFKREQNDGLDTDQGDVFKSSLEADGRDAGFDPTTFNTATDVEQALQAIGSPEPEKTPQPTGPVAVSPELAHAKARVQQYEQEVMDGTYTARLYDMNYRPGGEDNFLNRYKSKLGTKTKDGMYINNSFQNALDAGMTKETLNSSRTRNISDSAELAKTGNDERDFR